MTPETFSADRLTLNVMIDDETIAPEFALTIPDNRLEQLALKAINTACEAYELDFEQFQANLNIVGEAAGREFNRQYRQKDYATNILTFEYGVDPEHNLLTDLVLCWPVVQREAAEQHKPLANHVSHIFVHGILHALGFDHLDDAEAEEMEGLEKTVLKNFGIPDPYV